MGLVHGVGLFILGFLAIIFPIYVLYVVSGACFIGSDIGGFGELIYGVGFFALVSPLISMWLNEVDSAFKSGNSDE